jgi:hypothetical protein
LTLAKSIAEKDKSPLYTSNILLGQGQEPSECATKSLSYRSRQVPGSLWENGKLKDVNSFDMNRAGCGFINVAHESCRSQFEFCDYHLQDFATRAFEDIWDTGTFGPVHKSRPMSLEDLNLRKVRQSQPLDVWGSSGYAPGPPRQCVKTLCICQTTRNYYPSEVCESPLLLEVSSSRETGRRGLLKIPLARHEVLPYFAVHGRRKGERGDRVR